MTLIAYHGFGDGARPIFLSDVLVSARGKPKGSVNLPTVGNIGTVNLKGADYAIRGLAQKVTIIGKNIAIATAGGSIWCRTFIKDISELCSNTKMNNSHEFQELINSYFSRLESHQDLRDLKNVSSIFSYIYIEGGNQKGISFYFSGDGKQPFGCDSPVFDQVLAFGSGAKSYTKLMCGLRTYRNGQKYPNQFYRDLSLSFTGLGKFLAEEVQSGAGHLHEFWGGGYELTAFYDGCFHKLDQILYLVADLRPRNNYQRYDVQPVRLLKTHYEGEHLFVRSLNVRDLGENKFAVTNDRTSYIRPLLPTNRPPRSVKPRLDGNNLLCFTSIYESPSKSVDTSLFLIPSGSLLRSANNADGLDTLAYSIKELSGDVIEIKFTPKFMERLAMGVYAPTPT